MSLHIQRLSAVDEALHQDYIQPDTLVSTFCANVLIIVFLLKYFIGLDFTFCLDIYSRTNSLSDISIFCYFVYSSLLYQLKTSLLIFAVLKISNLKRLMRVFFSITKKKSLFLYAFSSFCRVGPVISILVFCRHFNWFVTSYWTTKLTSPFI